MLKITEKDVKITIAALQATTSNIHIATQTTGGNNVSMHYNTNYRTYTIRNRGVDYYATSRKSALKTFYYELYRTI